MKRICFIAAGSFSLLLAQYATAGVNVAPGARLTVNGTLTASTVQTCNGGTLAGNGTVAAAVTIDGAISPGVSPGILTTSNLVVNAIGSAEIEINGPGTAGVDFDQVNVTGTVTLNNPALVLSGLGVPPAPGGQMVLIANDGIDPVSGTFNGLPESAAVSLPTSGSTAFISYTGGTDQNDVILALDNDGDGLLDPSDPDDDNDNQSDVEELIAGTSGTDSNSFFAIDRIFVPNPVVVRIDTYTGRLYSVEYNIDLDVVPQNWTLLTNDIPGTGLGIDIVDPAVASGRTYRAGVRLAQQKKCEPCGLESSFNPHFPASTEIRCPD